MALFWRIWAAVTLVNLAVLAIFVGLATLQFSTINTALVSERLAVLAGRTAAPFESIANIGLPLSAMRNADALLERSRQTDDAIRAIHVFDSTGRVVHSTVTPAPSAVPAGAIPMRAVGDGKPWQQETSEGFLNSVGISARDGSLAGGVLIVYDGRDNVTRIRAMAAELALAAVLVQLAVAAVSMILLRVGLGRQIRSFEDIDQGIAGFERSAWRSTAGQRSPIGDGDSGDLRRFLEAAETQYRTAGRELAAVSDDAP